MEGFISFIAYVNVIMEKIVSCRLCFTSIQIIFWWMSVDNYFTKSNFIDYIKFFKLYDVIKLIYIRILNNQNIFKGLSLYELKKVKNKNIHVYQSAYAKHFLLKISFVDIMPLTDYINTDFSISIDLKMNKENIILYNRAKGYRLTRKIIKKLPELTFIPLANFTRVQLSELFARSKVYIDFGNHPGKDRMPREAVLNNCCVIVGKNGAANFFEDIPILNRYKIAYTDIDEIVKSIKYCINNYDDANNDFDFYRKTILNEKEKFYQEINSIFNLNRLNP